VVSHLYHRSSLILTSNKSVTEWPEVFGDHAIATAILDRLLRHAHVLSIKANSYRLCERTLAALSAAPEHAPAA
jgi:DNA replication protein DnaC